MPQIIWHIDLNQHPEKNIVDLTKLFFSINQDFWFTHKNLINFNKL